MIIIAELLATFFYIGYFPVFPGTAASFASAVICWFLPTYPAFIMLMITGVFFLLGVLVSSVIERHSGTADPSHIVIDELVGMGLPLIFLPKTLAVYGCAFIAFRFFDISKIFPVGVIEKKVPGGWGIMADDLIAGIMTFFLTYFIIFLDVL